MKKYFLFALLAMFIVGCDGPNVNNPSGGDSDDDGGGSNKSYVVTGEAKNVTYKSVTLYGEVNVEVADYETIEWGMMYSTDMDELEDRNGVIVACDDALIENAYRVDLSNLVSETKYYYCAYVNLNNKQYKFGETKEFTTLAAPGVDEITILTGSAEDVTNNSVVLYGELEANMSDYTSVQYGISYSTNRNDLQSDNSTLVYCSESLQDNSYSVALSGLEAETKYYYCAFVYVNNQDFKYGSIKNFTTAEKPTDSGILNGYEWIDLGLPSGLKWATCNVGASKPEDYGDYFAWGETEPKDYYDWSTYKWCNGSYDTQTKYNDYSSYGTVDNKTTLELSDDAARANWGGSWRMPTKAEQDELRNNCTRTWTTQNGVNGYKVTSNSNGKSIFLPAAGYRDGSSLCSAGSSGYYWSSSLYSGYPNNAYYLGFYSSVDWHAYSRYYGHPVRPVCP